MRTNALKLMPKEKELFIRNEGESVAEMLFAHGDGGYESIEKLVRDLVTFDEKDVYDVVYRDGSIAYPRYLVEIKLKEHLEILADRDRF